MRFEFLDDVDDHYHYNQFDAVTLTDNELVNLDQAVNLNHLNVIRDFVMKRNYCLTIRSNALDPLELSGPLIKIFGRKISGDGAVFTIDDQDTLVRFNLFGPLYYTIDTNGEFTHQ